MRNEIILTKANELEIEALSNALSNYKSTHTPSASLTNRQRVVSLRTPISEMISEGFTYNDVAKALSAGGLELKASTIREYLKDSSNKKPAKRKVKSAIQEKQKENNHGNETSNDESNNILGISLESIAKQRTSNEIPEDDFSNL